MSLHPYIRVKIKKIFRMEKGKDQRTVRFSPAVTDEIDKLVADGKYASFSDFVARAVHEFLHHENMEERIRQIVRDELKKNENNSSLPE